MKYVPLLLLASFVSLTAQEPFLPQDSPLGQPGPPPQDGPPPQGGMPPGPDLSPAEIQKIFDGYLIIQVREALGLTDQQFAQLVPRITTLQDTRRRFQQQRIRLLNELQRLTRPAAGGGGPGDEAMIKERLSALQENEARSAAEMRKAYNALDEVLDIRQQARFRVFEENIERKKLDLLMRARQQQQPIRPNANPNRALPKRPPGGR